MAVRFNLHKFQGEIMADFSPERCRPSELFYLSIKKTALKDGF